MTVKSKPAPEQKADIYQAAEKPQEPQIFEQNVNEAARPLPLVESHGAAMMVQPVAESGWLRIIEKAIEKGTPVDQLGKLLDIQERWEKEQARKAYVKAVAEFKKTAPELVKDRTVNYPSKGGGTVTFSYVQLSTACKVLAPELSQHGLHHSWKVDQKAEQVQDEGGRSTTAWHIQVTCILCHEMGHSESVTLVSTPDFSGGKDPIKALASAVSYLERYTFLAILGMAAEGQDDDAKGAESGTLNDEQIAWIDARLHEMQPFDPHKRDFETIRAAYLNWAKPGCTDPAEIPQTMFPKIRDELERVLRRQKQPTGKS